MRKKIIVTMTGLVLALGAGGIVLTAQTITPTSSGAEADDAGPQETTEVVRGPLTDSQRFSGTLGYGPSAPLQSTAAGTLTSVPAVGQEIGLGEPLYAVDEHPVRAFHGAVPMYRTLEHGLDGADVQQLKDSLRVLGFPIDSATAEFDDDTEDAVEAWQRANGLDDTGRVGPDDIAFVPGVIRVDRVTTPVGAQAGGTVIDYTSTERSVTAPVEETELAAFAIGQQVDIGLRSGVHLAGTVRSIGLDAGEAGRSVLISVADVPADLAPGTQTVDVEVAREVRTDVLTVPIVALTVDGSGEYAVEVGNSSKRRLIPVQVDAFAGGRAAISGEGIRAGLDVVVPA